MDSVCSLVIYVYVLIEPICPAVFSLIDIVYSQRICLFALQGQDTTAHNLFERNYMPMLYVPFRHRALSVRSFALPVALKEIPLVKSTSLVLTRQLSSCHQLLLMFLECLDSLHIDQMTLVWIIQLLTVKCHLADKCCYFVDQNM